LRREPWKVPKLVHDVVPFCAGATLEWQLD
jgi:hypothetical protein